MNGKLARKLRKLSENKSMNYNRLKKAVTVNADFKKEVVKFVNNVVGDKYER